jgi:hypothetical protein
MLSRHWGNRLPLIAFVPVMPIKFRCPHCEQFLGISRAKAGTVTDCPTCGRTIRIPNLDGTRAPLPAPQLNLNDDQLREALGALASLGAKQDPSPLPEAAAERQPIRRTEPAPQAKLVPRFEEEPEVLAVAVPHVEDASDFSLVSDREVFEQLNRIPVVAPSRGSDVTRKIQVGPVGLFLAAFCSAVCGVGIGYAFTRAKTTPMPAAAASQPDAATLPPATPKPESEPAPTAQTGVTGTVTYENSPGQSRPDAQARILLLPMQRAGTARLAAIGLRVGAEETDQKLLQAGVAALGGAMTLADENGRFALPAVPAGWYGLLVVSHYQSRPQNLPVPGACRSLLEKYFERPEEGLGHVQLHFQELDLDGPREGIVVHFALLDTLGRAMPGDAGPAWVPIAQIHRRRDRT